MPVNGSPLIRDIEVQAAACRDRADQGLQLQRWWTAWSKAPPPPQLQALISSVAAGCGLHLYIPN